MNRSCQGSEFSSSRYKDAKEKYFCALIDCTLMKKIITTASAPAPIGPYSQAVLVNNTLYISGQIALIPGTGNLETINMVKETNQVMHNLMNILKEAGMDFSNVVKTTIFLTDMSDFATVNEVYGSYFSSDFPARETVQVSALPRNVHVEISMIAAKL